jgi:FixJ family two-component response regulator
MTSNDNERGTVLVIDDDSSIRDALSRLFRSIDLDVQSFASTADFLAAKQPDGPTCLVLDVRLPGMSGLDFQSELKKANVDLPIIFMTGHGDIPMSVQAMKAGAVEFLPKPFRDQEMLDAVQAGLERDRARRASAGTLEQLKSRFGSLTEREREVMSLVATGLMNKQIASKLGVSEITVKVHRGSLVKKMGAKSVVELARMADALGVRLSGK